MKKTVTITTAQDPSRLGILLGGSQAIEEQEARGQRELVNADVLPADGLTTDRAVWEAMGIKIGDPVVNDDMFTHVELPAGWAKRATDHSMWSELADNKGRSRGRIFYKAAFYDRSAHISPVQRFSVGRDFDRDDYRKVMQYRVLDCGKAVFVSAEFPIPQVDGKQDWKATDRLEQQAQAECKAWLCEHGYPDYNNATAYWD